MPQVRSKLSIKLALRLALCRGSSHDPPRCEAGLGQRLQPKGEVPRVVNRNPAGPPVVARVLCAGSHTGWRPDRRHKYIDHKVYR